MSPAKSAAATGGLLAASAALAYAIDRWPAATYLSVTAAAVYIKFRSIPDKAEA